jgi:hypothetical protein
MVARATPNSRDNSVHDLYITCIGNSAFLGPLQAYMLYIQGRDTHPVIARSPFDPLELNRWHRRVS